jgi:hypothetical protein
MLRQSSLWRVTAASVCLMLLAAAVSGKPAQTPNPTVFIRVLDPVTNALTEAPLDANSPMPRGKLPVLFVHGHNPDANDDPPNYRKNWQDPLNSLPSFMTTLDLPDNAGLGIEDYYIRFSDQNRSITDDAAEIGAAIELILHRHDSNYPAQHPTTNVRVVIIAYSKGTLSSRLYLKNLEAEGRSFRPVSEFIAISPPNHGINVAGPGILTSTAVQEMVNGHGLTSCSSTIFPAATRNFIANLNGHPITDTQYVATSPTDPTPLAPANNAGEAPDSRSPTERPIDGILYVTLFADQNRDMVGGDTILAPPNSDCEGRRLAKNLSSDALNLPIAGITDDGWQTISSFFGTLNDDQKRAIAVHQNTVHTPEVICQTLYAAVHHRSPEGQTCTPGANSVPIIPPPARAAAMLSLDFSGSMSALTEPGGLTRAEALRAAVELFVQLWTAVSVPSDRIGVNYFSTNVTRVPATGDELSPLSTGGLAIIGDLNNHSPGGMTAMGGGLQRAIETLKGVAADTPIRRVILFTDGMQNVNPMVQTAGNHLVIDNQTGRPNSNVPTASPTPIILDSSLGISVDTIGIGASEDFVGLLQDISSATNRRSWPTNDPAFDLRRFFVEELINTLKGFSPQLVAYRRSAVASNGSTEAFAIEDGVRKLVLKLSWKRGDALDFSVAKDGVDVTSAGHFIKGGFYKIFVIDLPAKGTRRITARGNWQLRIKGKATTAYEAAAIVDGGRMRYDAIFDTRQPRVGNQLDLVVRVTADGRPIDRNASVTVSLKSPTTAINDILAKIPRKELTAFEPGMTLAEQRLLVVAKDPQRWAALKPRERKLVLSPNDKGEFRTRFRPRVPGIYTALVAIEGEGGKIGKFSRTVTAITVVRSAK